jgi:hypothetical protein
MVEEWREVWEETQNVAAAFTAYCATYHASDDFRWRERTLEPDTAWDLTEWFMFMVGTTKQRKNCWYFGTYEAFIDGSVRVDEDQIELGWILPCGRLVGVNFAGHGFFANSIGHDESDLEDAGWVRVHALGKHQTHGHSLSCRVMRDHQTMQ